MRLSRVLALLLLTTIPSWACGVGYGSPELLLALLGVGIAYLSGPPMIAAPLFLRGRGLSTVRFLAYMFAGVMAGCGAAVLSCMVGLWFLAVPASVTVCLLFCRIIAPARVVADSPGLGLTPA